MKLLTSSIPLGILLGINILNASAVPNSCVADAGANQILNITVSNQSVLLDGGGSGVTPGAGSITSYKWYDGATYLGDGITRWYTPSTLGFHQITLKIQTSADCNDTDIVAVTAINTLQANAGQDLTITLTPSNPSVTLDGSASISGANESDIVKYEWFDNAGNSLGTGSTLDFTPPSSGLYTITLTITDTAGDTASDTVNINATVLTSDPATNIQADAGSDVTLTVTSSQRAVQLDGTNSFAVNGIVSYTWYDNNTYIGPNSTRWYVPNGAGDHDIKLVIMDAQGNTHEDHMTLTVVE